MSENTVGFTVRLPPEVHDALKQQAKENGRTLASEAAYRLRLSVRRTIKKPEPTAN